MTDLPSPLPILVFSDFICPWCYIGLAEVEKLRQEYDIDVTLAPFQLRPGLPPEGQPRTPNPRTAAVRGPLKARAEQLGIRMEMDAADTTPNTIKAHEAAEFARDQGAEAYERFHKRVLDAYWSDGENIGLPDVLCRLAEESALDPKVLRQALDAGTYAERVQEGFDWARELGVHSIPTFLIADQYAIEGAQEYQVFRGLMEQMGVPRKATPETA